MKNFLYAMRYRLICTAISLAFLAWHNHITPSPLTPLPITGVAAHAQ